MAVARITPVRADDIPQESRGDSVATEASGGTLIPIPIYFYTPETKSGFGAMAAYYFRTCEECPGTHPSAISAIGIYTTRKQTSALLAADLYLGGGRYRLQAALGYARFPDTFWGVGNETPDSNEEDFTPRTVQANLALQKRIAPHWYVGGLIGFADRKLVETVDGGLLHSGAIPGSRDGHVVSVGALALHDSRDHTVFPRRGAQLRYELALFDDAVGSDYSFVSHTIDLRGYRKAIGSSVLALRSVALLTTATPPFDLLPGVGGDTLLRGYYAGRYRDRELLAAQAEIRAPGVWRIGWVAFASAGQVAHAAEEFRLADFRLSGGVGLRILFNEAEGLNLRADVGFGEGTSGFYLGIGEVF